eukprot:3049359-Rhodomonas_salina.1
MDGAQLDGAVAAGAFTPETAVVPRREKLSKRATKAAAGAGIAEAQASGKAGTDLNESDDSAERRRQRWRRSAQRYRDKQKLNLAQGKQGAASKQSPVQNAAAPMETEEDSTEDARLKRRKQQWRDAQQRLRIRRKEKLRAKQKGREDTEPEDQSQEAEGGWQEAFAVVDAVLVLSQNDAGKPPGCVSLSPHTEPSAATLQDPHAWHSGRTNM